MGNPIGANLWCSLWCSDVTHLCEPGCFQRRFVAPFCWQITVWNAYVICEHLGLRLRRYAHISIKRRQLQETARDTKDCCSFERSVS